MKIYSINSNYQPKSYQNFGVKKFLRENTTSEQKEQINAPAFKGGRGFGIGTVVTGGVCLIGVSALAMATLSNPVGWGTLAAVYFGSVGASAAGGYLGHKIEQKINKNNEK